MKPSFRLLSFLFAAAAPCSLLAGCAVNEPAPTSASPEDDEMPLSDLDAILAGAPDNADLPEEGKADTIYPAKFDLLSTQSPVRNQASRGVCSIFATVGLMEHLYIAGGADAMPDFSEQFLQWSAKNEVGDFANTEGSSAQSNIAAISQYGIPVESAWPYETTKWGASDDEACNGGENLPTKCYTNGEPPETALAAQRFRLPRGRYVNSSERSLKDHLTTTNTGVVVGFDFFYQSWNHRLSQLPVNAEYKAAGYVLYPNADDRRISLEKRAGHAILIVGWDDDLEVQQVDKDGNLMVDAEGNPVMERGFFLFKNSWGTGAFGTTNPFGAGYGWISYRYIAEFGHAQISGLPEAPPAAEICDDNRDNDRDGRVDCLDSDCATFAGCASVGGPEKFESTTSVAIPDNAPSRGARSTIDVNGAGTIASLSVTVDITHPYRGDISVTLEKNGRRITLFNRTGGSADDLRQTFTVPDLAGADAGGVYTLIVSDHARSDVGRLNKFSLELTRR